MAEEPTPPPPGPRSEADILADPVLRGLLAGYQPLFQELFLKGYARVLADLHRNGEVYENNLEYLLHQHDKEAYKYLWAIQHQKLFDLECQWRAGAVAVPPARLTADFDDWHEYIEECPVLTPITADDLALLDQFLSQLPDEHDFTIGNPSHRYWMRRRYGPIILDEDEDEDSLQLEEWTEFWDLHRGTGYLRQLPDLRGDLEHRYQEAVREQYHATAPPHAPEDPRPPVPTYGEEYDALVRDWLRRFEPPARLRQFDTKQQLEAYDASEDRLDLPLALERLQNAGPVLVPIEGHADWREAIIAAGHRHYLGQLRAALPRVYEEYCQREAFGISHAPPKERSDYHTRNQHFGHMAECIREGRRLLGEPDDLDF